ncbi:enolase C-terminal domain-like protein [Rubinisphaera margarita]|uniref:enolase C-terminal domain-like protein n=1 Tax=Rubinisphaera margarita TaxID=2909586 RepID=UPI001EE87C12|nr:enolase C-terminal domain-like protein [Rubinisphaera margarita]MCG6154306.1 fuconate dehydratase [Rubinisphaera margarita]
MATRILDLHVDDLRFPTSRELDGSDAMNEAPDYSVAYVTLDTSDHDLRGNGITFTIGRGNEIVVSGVEALRDRVVGLTLEEITADMGGFWRHITSDSQLRWIGPEKGVIHLATAAVVNAVWDLWAKSTGKPLWKLVADFSPEEFVRCIDFRYLTDVVTPEAALERLRKLKATQPERLSRLQQQGYPAYTTSAGWLGYSDERLRELCRLRLSEGWEVFKIKVGRDLEDDRRRCRIIREEIGPDRLLLTDANQVWDVQTAIDWMQQLAEFNPWAIEEPTSPDDVLGYAKISKALHPIRVAGGEHCANRVMFKQFLEAGGMQVCQIDACRLGGVNEVLAVLLLAAEFDVPVCPHAGGVGLCEYVQHLSIIDYLCVSGSLENRMAEHAGTCHEHFVDPIRIRNGHYLLPKKPGYSITMFPESIEKAKFPSGEYWRD